MHRNIPESERPPEPSVQVPMSRSLNTLALPEGTNGEDIYLIAPIDSSIRFPLLLCKYVENMTFTVHYILHISLVLPKFITSYSRY